jgi:hypothetical protein
MVERTGCPTCFLFGVRPDTATLGGYCRAATATGKAKRSGPLWDPIIALASSAPATQRCGGRAGASAPPQAQTAIQSAGVQCQGDAR